jgi:hypothetical protein
MEDIASAESSLLRRASFHGSLMAITPIRHLTTFPIEKAREIKSPNLGKSHMA